MFQFQFILGVTILVITGTLAFTFHYQQSENSRNSSVGQSNPDRSAESSISSRKSDRAIHHPSGPSSPSAQNPKSDELKIAASSLSNLNQADLVHRS